MWNISNVTFWTIVSWLKNYKESLFKAKLELNYKYIYVIYRVASQYSFLLTVKEIRFATGFHENWNLERCNLTYKSGYLQGFF